MRIPAAEQTGQTERSAGCGRSYSKTKNVRTSTLLRVLFLISFVASFFADRGDEGKNKKSIDDLRMLLAAFLHRRASSTSSQGIGENRAWQICVNTRDLRESLVAHPDRCSCREKNSSGMLDVLPIGALRHASCKLECSHVTHASATSCCPRKLDQQSSAATISFFCWKVQIYPPHDEMRLTQKRVSIYYKSVKRGS
jgi:hypothetical protein